MTGRRGRARSRQPPTEGLIRTFRYLQVALANAAQDRIVARSRARRLRLRCSWWIARLGGHGAWSLVPFGHRLLAALSRGAVRPAREDAERMLGVLQSAIDVKADAISNDASLERRVLATIELLGLGGDEDVIP